MQTVTIDTSHFESHGEELVAFTIHYSSRNGTRDRWHGQSGAILSIDAAEKFIAGMSAAIAEAKAAREAKE